MTKDARPELVRIDSRGEPHPIGNIASHRMRARAGAYRILPAPQHVVFMRYTGEDGRRDVEDGAVVRPHTVSANGLLMDGVTRMDELRYFRQKIPSAEHVPVRIGNRRRRAQHAQTDAARIRELRAVQRGRGARIGAGARVVEADRPKPRRAQAPGLK